MSRWSPYTAPARMRGIAGIYSKARPRRETVERMVARLIHRGPDSAGYWSSGLYAAGMGRLSIFDLAGGDQPLYYETGRVVVFYNGEIYNGAELKVSKVDFRGYSGFSIRKEPPPRARHLCWDHGFSKKHMTIDKAAYRPDHACSMTPDELRFINAFRNDWRRADSGYRLEPSNLDRRDAEH